MRIQFKFRRRVSEDERAKVISSLREHGAESLQRLFAGDPDQELSTLYTLDTAHQASAQRLLNVLDNSSAIEFAETRSSSQAHLVRLRVGLGPRSHAITSTSADKCLAAKVSSRSFYPYGFSF